MSVDDFRLTKPTPKSAAIFVGGSLGALILSVASTNPILTFAAIATAALLVALLRRPEEPPMLLFAVGIQWLQVSTKLFYADILGLPIEDLLEEAGDLNTATFIALVGLCVLTLGIRLGLAIQKVPAPAQARSEALNFSLTNTWIGYLTLLAIETGMTGVLPQMSGLYQPLLSLLALKWAFLFVLAYIVLVRKIGVIYLIAAIILEVLISFGGFFGGFKSVFLIILVGTLTARVRLTFGQKFLITSTFSVLMLLCIVWSAIKQDYRSVLNQDSGVQIVLASPEERLDYLREALSAFSYNDFLDGVDKLVSRVAYIDAIAAVIDHVPALVPYTGGTQTSQAILHILTPRLLFPDKPATPSDSEVTRQFTDLDVSGESQGTSISIGYMSELYVDFGPYIMHMPLLVIGFLYGLMYCILLKKGRGSLLMNYGLTVMVYFGVASFEIALIKLVGSVGMTFLIAFLISRFVLPWAEPKWINVSKPQSPSVRPQ